MADEQSGSDRSVSRRGFLGAGGAAGAAHLLPGAVGSSSLGSAPRQVAPDGPAVHAHSGPESGGARLRPSALASAETPVVNVSAHGVVGDGETDDSAPFQAAVDAATPRGVLYVPPDVDLYFESPVDVDLGASASDPVPFAFVCDGTLRPAPGIGDAVTVHDGGYVYLDVRVAGGGAPDDVAVVVTRSHWSYYEGAAVGFDGTFYELRWGAKPGQSWSVGTLQGFDCGQTLHVAECGGVGQVGKLIDVAPTRLARLTNPVDCSVGTYVGVADEDTEAGLTVESPTSLWIDSLQVAGTPDIDNVTVTSPNYASVRSVDTSGGDRGLVVTDANTVQFDNVEAYDNRVGVDLDASVRTRLHVDAHDNDERGLVVRGASGIANRVSGRVVDNGAPVRVVPVGGTLSFSDFAAVGNDGPAPGPDALGDPDADSVQMVVEGQEFSQVDVRIADAQVPAIDGDPRHVNHAGAADGVSDLRSQEFQVGPPPWSVGDAVEVDGEGVYLRGLDDTWWRID